MYIILSSLSKTSYYLTVVSKNYQDDTTNDITDLTSSELLQRALYQNFLIHIDAFVDYICIEKLVQYFLNL